MSGGDKSGRSGVLSGRPVKLQEHLEPWVDAVGSVLLASGLLQLVWIWRGYPAKLLSTVLICAGLAALSTALTRLRGWLVLLIPLMLLPAALLLVRMSVGAEAFTQQLAGLWSWLARFFQWTTPAPPSAICPRPC